jgi:hypothetical protein
VVANHPVALQVEHTLATVSMLISRQALVERALRDRDSDSLTAQIDVLARGADADAQRFVSEGLRASSWVDVATALRDRAVAADMPLRVSYSPTLIDRQQLAWRTPILRLIYNQMPAVRQAIDRVAAAMSQGLSVLGGGASVSAARFATDLLDLSSQRAYLAHLTRDAFVCGNGYLTYGSLPDEDVRLLMPERVMAISGDTATIATSDGEEQYRRVIHVKGDRSERSRDRQGLVRRRCTRPRAGVGGDHGPLRPQNARVGRRRDLFGPGGRHRIASRPAGWNVLFRARRHVACRRRGHHG